MELHPIITCVYRAVICLTAMMICPPVGAAIIVGPFTFDDRAFADDATQIDAGTLQLFGGATSLDDALTGYSPTKCLINIGYLGAANHFQLDFIDLPAINAAGDDIVFFDARFSPDPYEIAVRPEGGSFTVFRRFEANEFFDTGVTGPGTFGSDVFALAFDLDDFGIASGTIVDAFQFRSLRNQFNNIEGDPIMAAVLNSPFTASAGIPEPSTAVLLGLAAAIALGLRQRLRS